ncbi:MAG: hypothetical protein IIU47_03730 [Lachnospiraceae bacterium]|nr:hypothetical protein [Lachnospiraceae bacterium]MBQ5360130.1 hypothetical protein [Lachnospiraceae bacterium]
MDYRAERFFVSSFIRKDRRERLLLQLTSPSRRYEGISRFCLQASDLIDSSRIFLEGKDLERQKAFTDFANGHRETCLCLSPDPCLHERVLLFAEAADIAFMGCDAALVIGSSFALVVGEAVKGGREKYLLSVSGRDDKMNR